MSTPLDKFPTQEFCATISGSANQVMRSIFMVFLCAWLTYGATKPNVLLDFGSEELHVIFSLLILIPVSIRVLICGTLFLTAVNFLRVKLSRNISNTPLLILSKEGVFGFKNGFDTNHIFIGWGDMKEATFNGKSAIKFKPKSSGFFDDPSFIFVSLSEIGVKKADMMALIERYQKAWASGQIDRQSQPATQYTNNNGRTADSAQFMKPYTPDFGERMTRL